jgi:hypothetical protein
MRNPAVRQPGQDLDPATRAHVAAVLKRCQTG